VPYIWLIPQGELGIIYVAGKAIVPQMEKYARFQNVGGTSRLPLHSYGSRWTGRENKVRENDSEIEV
jgi:hypothetical protein